MRRVFYALVVVCAFGVVSVDAAPKGNGPREGTARKAVKRMVRSLGDLITIPVPAPKP
jgi:hypothetical protein